MKEYIKYFKSIGILQTIGLLFNFLFYRLKYMELENKNGYFLVKRKWMWFLFTPLLLPLYLIAASVMAIIEGVRDYFGHIFNFYHHWIERSKSKLTFREKIIYRRNLWD